MPIYEPGLAQLVAANVAAGRLNFSTDLAHAVAGADAAAIVTEWDVFRALDLDRLAEVMTATILVDLRNIYSPAEITRTRFIYHSIGR